MVEPFIGMLQTFGFAFAPRDWALCIGQMLSIQQYQALYALIGSQYGGDWRNTMRVPDLRGRVNMHPGIPLGGGTINYVHATHGGIEHYVVPEDYMATHSHDATFTPSGGNAIAVRVSEEDGLTATPTSGDHLAKTKNGLASLNAFTATPGTTVSLGGVSGGASGGGSVTLDHAGTSSAALDNMMPSQAVNWCIALDGVFPSRN